MIVYKYAYQFKLSLIISLIFCVLPALTATTKS